MLIYKHYIYARPPIIDKRRACMIIHFVERLINESIKFLERVQDN